MKAPHGLFLDVNQEGHTLLSHYRRLLAGQSEALAKAFYDYLLSHEPTAEVFAGFSEAQMQKLVAAQTAHAQQMLTVSFDGEWNERVRELGRLHQTHGIKMSWIAGAYLIYQRHWDHLIHMAVPDQDQEPLRMYLHQLLMHDLMLQLEGYQCGMQKTDEDRTVLFSALLRSLTEAPEGTGTEEFLCAIFRELIRDSDTLCWSWYGVVKAGGAPLYPHCEHGLKRHPIIPDSLGDPCWNALRANQAIVFSLGDPLCPEWLMPLQAEIAEVAIMPFDVKWQHAVGVVGSKERGYFQRVGIDHFTAFAQMGDLVTTLHQQSQRDPLTGLPNRMTLDKRLEKALERSNRHQTLMAVVMFDLDGFKAVNDTYGHAAGDQLLIALARRLQTILRTTDSAFRLGGDEFVFLLNDLERWTDLEVVVERIRQAIEEP